MGFPTVKMPEQELPFVPNRCLYLERYYNEMVNEKEAAKKVADKRVYRFPLPWFSSSCLSQATRKARKENKA